MTNQQGKQDMAIRQRHHQQAEAQRLKREMTNIGQQIQDKDSQIQQLSQNVLDQDGRKKVF